MRTNQAPTTERLQIFGPLFTVAPDLSRVRELTNDNEAETLAFLGVRPVHTVVMTSFVRDNGIESLLNRGKFFGYRNAQGGLEGVALIGHTTLVEAQNDEALKALAFTARSTTTPIHLIMSGGDAATSFWNYLHGGSKAPSLKGTELLFETAFPFPVQQCEYDLRSARPEELEAVAVAQAEVAEIECGINPMVKDREGFLRRVMRRIEQGRIFVVFEDGDLVFKADIIAETDSVAYLEGVYVGVEHRGKGIGSKCLSKLNVQLLSRVQNVCLLSNVEFKGVHKTFLKAGMRRTGECTTLFV